MTQCNLNQESVPDMGIRQVYKFRVPKWNYFPVKFIWWIKGRLEVEFKVLDFSGTDPCFYLMMAVIRNGWISKSLTDPNAQLSQEIIYLMHGFTFKIYNFPFLKHSHILNSKLIWVFPGGPVVKTLRFHCSGCGFHPWSGNYDIPHATQPKNKQNNKKYWLYFWRFLVNFTSVFWLLLCTRHRTE